MSTTIIAEPGVPYITIVSEFNAPRELIFRAHTEPELLTQWMGPRGYGMRVDKLEVRDGGTWRYVHINDDGAEFAFRGVYHGNPSVDGIFGTWEWEGAPGSISFGKTTFDEKDGVTTVTQHSTYLTQEDRDGLLANGMERGVREGDERLAELLAALVPAS